MLALLNFMKEFVELSFKEIGITIVWKGSGIDEVGYDVETGRPLVFVDPNYFRPAEVEQLIGNATKAQEKLGWQPHLTFYDLVALMVKEDCKFVEKAVVSDGNHKSKSVLSNTNE